MKYDFDTVIERRNTFSTKWSPASVRGWGISERFDDNTISLFTADMDFRCAKPVTDAIEALAKHGIFGYSTNIDSKEYYDALCGWFLRRHGMKIAPESVVCVNGTVEAARFAIKAFTQEGEGVIITRPVYGPFTSVIEGSGRRVVNSDMINDGGYYRMDFEDIEQKAKDPSVKMFLHCSPHNPTGRVFSKEELERLADICERNGVLLVSDEVHCDIVRRGVKFISAALVSPPTNTVVLNALNKTFNCAGLQVSHAIIADPALREKYLSVSGRISPSAFASAALIAAYNEGEEWLEQLLDYLDSTIDETVAFVRERMPKVKVWRPEGTYVLWMDFRGTGLSSEEIHERIYNKANVCLEGGSFFDPDNGAGFERACLPSPRSVIREAFERIANEFRDIH